MKKAFRLNDKVQNRAIEYYSRLVGSKDLVTTAGRYAKDSARVKNIWADLAHKMVLGKSRSLLDIGCGYGTVTKAGIAFCNRRGISLTLMDIPPIIKAIRDDLKRSRSRRKPKFISGIFPESWPTSLGWKPRFDRIIMYGVVSCTEKPDLLIDAAIKLLKPGGLFLIGDIPNLAKKGRFLASGFGRRFDAIYKGIPLAKAPRYRRFTDFLHENRNNKLRFIDDDFCLGILRKYRRMGMDVYLLPQPPNLPFHYTREDILIQKSKD